MSFQNLNTLTRDLHLVDTKRIFEQGRQQYMAGFSKYVNPYAGGRHENVWAEGYAFEQDRVTRMLERWNQMDRGTR